MAFTHVVSAFAGSLDGDDVTTSGVNTTGANLLVVVCTDEGASPATITDSKGNTWSSLTTRSSSLSNVRIHYATPSSVGAGHTFTATGAAGSFPAICASAYGG